MRHQFPVGEPRKAADCGGEAALDGRHTFAVAVSVETDRHQATACTQQRGSISQPREHRHALPAQGISDPRYALRHEKIKPSKVGYVVHVVTSDGIRRRVHRGRTYRMDQVTGCQPRRPVDSRSTCYVPDNRTRRRPERTHPVGHQPQLFPVSVKGVVIRDGRVLLLRNERDEWELPGGKLELGEDPESCVAREITEEVGWAITTGPILDAWQYHIRDGVDVLIVTYGCHTSSEATPVVSNEHKEVGLFTASEAAALPMPDGYKRSVAAWYAQTSTPAV